MEKMPHGDETPFSDKLKPSDVSGYHNKWKIDKLNEFEGDSEKIVRVEKFENLEKRFKGKLDIVEAAQIASGLFRELEEVYGIKVPTQFVIGKNEKGEKVVYQLVDKIEGKSLGEAPKTPEFVNAVEKLYENISKYFLDKAEHGGFYLTDINAKNQYVYGKKKGETEDKMYLIDTDMYFHNGRAALYQTVEWLTRHMGAMESSLEVVFEEARKNIAAFASREIPFEKDTDAYKDVEEHLKVIQKFLDFKRSSGGSSDAIPKF
jgi:hypothetical protein